MGLVKNHQLVSFRGVSTVPCMVYLHGWYGRGKPEFSQFPGLVPSQGGPCIYEKCSDRWEVAFSLSERAAVSAVGDGPDLKQDETGTIPWGQYVDLPAEMLDFYVKCMVNVLCKCIMVNVFFR